MLKYLAQYITLDDAQRALRTFVQTLAGFFVGNVTVFSADWQMMLAVSVTAALTSLLNSVNKNLSVRKLLSKSAGKHTA